MRRDDDDIFDMLGISTREDSYTDLLVYAFECRPSFRGGFVRKFVPSCKVNSDSGWACIVRRPIKVKGIPPLAKPDGSWPEQLAPDLLLVNRQAGKVVLIENKIHAGAGTEQRLYAHAEFKRRLRSELVGDRAALPDEEVDCFYLSLDGEGLPAGFKDLRHRDLVELFGPEDRCENCNLGRLLDEYCRRVAEHAEWRERVLEDIPLKDYFVPHGLITEEQLFDKLLAEVDEVLTAVGVTARVADERLQHEGGIDFWRGWAKGSWTGEGYKEWNDGATANRVQFSLLYSGPDGKRKLRLRLEYHCGLPKKKFDQLPEEFTSAYRSRRNRFWDGLQSRQVEMENVGYSLRNYWYFLAGRQFDQGMNTHAFLKEVRQMIRVAVPIVDGLLCDHDDGPGHSI